MAGDFPSPSSQPIFGEILVDPVESLMASISHGAVTPPGPRVSLGAVTPPGPRVSQSDQLMEALAESSCESEGSVAAAWFLGASDSVRAAAWQEAEDELGKSM